jgi:hypothetical protein
VLEGIEEGMVPGEIPLEVYCIIRHASKTIHNNRAETTYPQSERNQEFIKERKKERRKEGRKKRKEKKSKEGRKER